MNLTDQNFETEIKNTDKLVIVDFFAEWCEPCKILAPILEKVASELKEKVILMKVNLDDAPQTAGKFNVDRIPTVIVFQNGKAITGFVGMINESAIKDMLNNILTGKNPAHEEYAELSYNYAISQGFHLNPDKKTTDRVINGLFENEKKYGKKYCPCRRVTGDAEKDAKIICPCVYHKDEITKDGHCICNLFVK
jgi:thioredoxin